MDRPRREPRAGLRIWPRIWKGSMTGRDPQQEHRASTPLECLFDLCFVVAVSQAAASLRIDLADRGISIHHSLIGYATVFFAIWWAWVNFTWFASAYDTDDIPYRLLTFLQIAGVLVLGAGVGRAFSGDFAVMTVGYVIMRVAMTTQWLRAAATHIAGRATARRYAGALIVTQLGWIGRLFLPGSWGYATFAILALAEVLTPVFAEHTAHPTQWHPEHIAERYGLFTLIVLGECVLSAFVAINAAVSDRGAPARLVIVAASGLVIVFGLWWSYFRIPANEMLKESPNLSFVWGYVHYFLFAAVAALGAGIALAAEATATAADPVRLSSMGLALAVGIPVSVTLVLMTFVRALVQKTSLTDMIGWIAAALVLAAAFSARAIGL
ncbi:MAG TPA: low temperature requirement protein A, partial [Ilumatobacteraceae bacterium]